MLYTNHPVETLPEAVEVIFGYAQRWHIEEFHRTCGGLALREANRSRYPSDQKAQADPGPRRARTV
jgi:hypothetical protein